MFKNNNEFKSSFDFLTKSSPLSKATFKDPNQAEGHIYFTGGKDFPKDFKVLKWQIQKWQATPQPVACFATFEGPLWVVCLQGAKKHSESYKKVLGDPGSDYGFFRDHGGAAFIQALAQVKKLGIHFSSSMNKSAMMGALVGLEMGGYNFQSKKVKLPEIIFSSKNLKTFKPRLLKSSQLGQAVNLARHLVNLPAEFLNPVDYTQAMGDLFFKSQVKVQVWDEKDLKKEGMNLVLAVGRAGSKPPRVVKLSYRPIGTAKQKPLVFVGKGVTYDTGGLNIKPGTAMRMMKKDMGGSAACAGLMWYLKESKAKVAVDVYLGLAENSIAANAFRPGDILLSKKGLSVEIDNTDAEGRLVLADVMTLAQQKPLKSLIDVATLTGAIKASLGIECAGLFANNPALSESLFKASRKSSDELWPMPLVDSMKAKALGSSVADLVNSANSWGGAVSAALFLEAFVEPKTSWAHLDIFAATPKCKAFQHDGGSGQMVQCLSFFLDGKLGS